MYTHINTGLYTFLLTGVPAKLQQSLEKLYPDSINTNTRVADYQIDIKNGSFLRRLLRPQIIMNVDGYQPFNPTAPDKLLAALEWTMNWCIAAYDHSHLLIHCSVVEKNGKVILFPARSGSGKSTTSTYLALNGWNLFFDEMAIIDLNSGKVKPVFRPTSLKNNSIDIIHEYLGDAYISEVTRNTHKGDIAHVRPFTRDYFDTLQEQEIFSVVFLNFDSGYEFDVYQVDQSIGFSKLVHNAFNYSVIGERAFKVLVDIVNKIECYEVAYSNLNDISHFLEELVGD